MNDYAQGDYESDTALLLQRWKDSEAQLSSVKTALEQFAHEVTGAAEEERDTSASAALLRLGQSETMDESGSVFSLTESACSTGSAGRCGIPLGLHHSCSGDFSLADPPPI